MPVRRAAALRMVVALASATLAALVPAAHAAAGTVFAQSDPQGQQQGGEKQQNGDVGGETGAGGQTEQGASTAETGPPWTYQMARLGLVLLVLLFVAVGLWYYRLVVVRARGG